MSTPKRKNPAAVRLGRLGGIASAKTRMALISPARRTELARIAAIERWRRFREAKAQAEGAAHDAPAGDNASPRKRGRRS